MKKSVLIALLKELETCVASGERLELRLENPHLVRCWEVMRCGRKRCPAYGRHGQRCWQLVGTFCDQSRLQGIFENKWDDCRRCPVFVSSTPNKEIRVQELINNIIFAANHTRLDILAETEHIKRKVDRIASTFRLTPRETEVLLLVVSRLSRREMARALFVTEETVKMHVRNLYRKTGVGSRQALLRELARHLP